MIEWAQQLNPEPTSSRNKKTKPARECIRGLNLQAKCKEHFGAKLGGIKVCVLRQQCTDQKWRLLTEKQQKSFYQLPDAVKLSLGLDSIKGYKALGPKELQKRLEASKALPRLNIPAPVLEDRNVEVDDIGVIQTLCDFNTISFDRLPDDTGLMDN